VKLLVAIMTCHTANYSAGDGLTVDWFESSRCKDVNARRAAIRATWKKEFDRLGIDVKFFLGKTDARTPLFDEVFTDSGDKYHDNSYKLKCMCAYALENGYDYMLRLDDDVYIYPDRIIATEWQQHDYSGAPCGNFLIGAVKFLSRRAMTLIRDSQVTHWADDGWVGTVMRNNRVPMHVMQTFHCKMGTEYYDDPARFPVNHRWSAFHSCYPSVIKTFWERDHGPCDAPNVGRGTKGQALSAPPITVNSVRSSKAATYSPDGLTLDWWDTHPRN
jgi:hypothetical protein